jgi:hypothetical protein
MRQAVLVLTALLVPACAGELSISGAAGTGVAPTDDGGQTEAVDAAVAGPDAAPRPECQWGGAPGKCLSASACTAIADHSPEPGSCPAALECCIDTPDIADNPPIPAGHKLMMQSQVTAAMTAWAVMILHDPVTWPMYATTTQTFGTLSVLALVEWHPPDFQNHIVHRGVTLFVPIGD